MAGATELTQSRAPRGHGALCTEPGPECGTFAGVACTGQAVEDNPVCVPVLSGVQFPHAYGRSHGGLLLRSPRQRRPLRPDRVRSDILCGDAHVAALLTDTTQ